MKHSFKYYRSLIVSILLSVVFVTYLVSRVEYVEILELLSSASVLYLFFAVLSLWLVFISNTLRYECILGTSISEVKSNVFILHALTMLTSLLAVIMPVSGLADVARIGVLWKKVSIPVTQATKSVIHDRLLALFLYLILGMFFFPAQYYYGFPEVILNTQIGIYTLLILSLLFILLLIKLSLFALVLKKHFNQFFGLLSTKKLLVKQVAYSFIGVIAAGISFWLCAEALGISMDIWVVIVFSPLLVISQNIPIFYSGWGSRDALVVISLGATFMHEVEALTVSILFGIVVMLSTLPGLIVLAKYNKIFEIREPLKTNLD